jgi:hypothetical protein
MRHLDYARASTTTCQCKWPLIAGAIGAVSFVLIAEVPLLVLGEHAAYFWMKWNGPLSWLVEDYYGLSPDTWGRNSVVVLVNAFGWGGCVAILCYLGLKAGKIWLR